MNYVTFADIALLLIFSGDFGVIVDKPLIHFIATSHKDHFLGLFSVNSKIMQYVTCFPLPLPLLVW